MLEILAIAIIQNKEIKGIRIGKEDVKLSLFADMIEYISDAKNSTKDFQQLINCNLAIFLINSKKNQLPSYTQGTKKQRGKSEKHHLSQSPQIV